MLTMFVRFAWKASNQVVEVPNEHPVATYTMKLVYSPGFPGVVPVHFAGATSSFLVGNDLILLSR